MRRHREQDPFLLICLFTRTMSKSIYRRGILICAVAVLGLALIMFAEPAIAQDFGLKTAANQAGLNTNRSVPEIIGGLIQAALGFVGVIFLVLMLYAGFLWMTARGNNEQVTKAKDLITGAIIGIVIVASAYAITSFVVGSVTGSASPSSSSSSSSGSSVPVTTTPCESSADCGGKSCVEVEAGVKFCAA